MTVNTRYNSSSDTISITLGKRSIFNVRHSETELHKQKFQSSLSTKPMIPLLATLEQPLQNKHVGNYKPCWYFRHIPLSQLAQSVYDWLRAGRSGDRIPVGARFFAHVQTGPGAHPASCIIGTGSFPGVKRPGRGADHPPPPSAEGENGYSYTTTPPLGPSWPVIG
jgi:hypothetical protein